MEYEIVTDPDEEIQADWEIWMRGKLRWEVVNKYHVGHKPARHFVESGWWRKPKRTNEATDWELVTDPNEIIQADWQFSRSHLPWTTLNSADRAIGKRVGDLPNIYWRRPKKPKWKMYPRPEPEVLGPIEDDEPQRLMDFFFPKSKMSYYK